jgi:hypothetical protein
VEKSYKNITTVSLPPETAPLFQEAARHFRFRNLAAFFRDCGQLLIYHYQRGDKLLFPLAFEVQKNERYGKK